MFPNPKTSYMEANTQKDEETGDFALKIALKSRKCAGGGPQVSVMLPKCVVTLQAHLICTYAPRKVPQVCWERAISAFFGVLSGKTWFLSPTSVENSPYKYHSSHS
jgi:hypothetical protein